MEPNETELAAIVDKMIAAGESDDDIQFVIAEHRKAQPAARPATSAPAARPNVHRDAQGHPYITDDPNDVQGSLAATIQDLSESGAGLDPAAVGLGADLKIPGMVLRNLPRVRLPFSLPSMGGVKSGVGNALKLGGDLLDNDLTGVISPRVKHAGGMIRRAGEALTKEPKVSPNAGGRLVKGSGDPLVAALEEVRTSVDTPGGSVELPPRPTLTPEGRPSITVDQARVTNPHMQQPGRSVGKPLSEYAPEPQPPAPVEPNPNAGGTLRRGTPSVPLEDVLAETVQSANTPAREAVDISAPPVNPLEQAGRFAGKPPEFYNPKPKAPEVPKVSRADRLEATLAEWEAMQNEKAASAASTTPIAAPAADAPLDPVLVKSELQKQLEASLAAQQGSSPAAGGIKPEMLRPSKSKGAMSATPGMTVDDVLSIGKDPNVPIEMLTPEEVTTLMASRAGRWQSKYEPAASDAAARRSVERGK